MLIYCSVIMKVLSCSRHLRKLDNVDISLRLSVSNSSAVQYRLALCTRSFITLLDNTGKYRFVLCQNFREPAECNRQMVRINNN